MAIKIIAAIGDKRLLGVVKDGKHGLPWRIPEDSKHFSHSTNGAVVIMGRSTWESLPDRFRPLPDRTNFVLTRNPDYRAEGARVFPGLHEALEVAETLSDKTIWIMGGASIYEQALPIVDELSLTIVEEELLPPPMGGEERILFPEYEHLFECIDSTPRMRSDNKNIPYRFQTWKRK
tara:strand:- start:3317 stop:3847 length:531 start_codon:yes stop_codon:yes gene_type:complete